MTSPGDTTKPDTGEMLVIHTALRREFALLPAVVGAVMAGDRPRAREVAAHTRLTLAFLHAHHDSEDRLLWPLLMQRLSMQTALIETMEQQHAAVATLGEAITGELVGWIQTAGTADRHALVGHLTDLHTALEEHLDLEEAAVLPLIRDHLSIAEWNASFDHAQHHTDVGARTGLLLVGMVLEDALPQERTQFLGRMPAVARGAWRLLGPRQYREHTDIIRRDLDITPTPPTGPAAHPGAGNP